MNLKKGTVRLKTVLRPGLEYLILMHNLEMQQLVDGFILASESLKGNSAIYAVCILKRKVKMQQSNFDLGKNIYLKSIKYQI